MRRPRPWILLLCLGLCACASVVPADAEFASERDPYETACKVLVQGEGAGEPMIVGAVLPLTRPDGGVDARGLHRSQAMTLAFEEMNQRSGIGDRPFRLLACDTQSGWVASAGDEARDLATWLVKERGANAILCGGSADTLAIHPVARNLGALLMSVSGTSIEITDLVDDGLVWRVAPSDRYQGIVLGELAVQALAESGGKKVALLAISNPYGDGLVKVIGDYIPGGAATPYTIKVDGSNLKTELARVAKDKADVLAILAPADMAAQAVNALSEHPELAKVRLLFSDSVHNPDFLEAVTDTARLEAARGTLPGAPASPALNTFRARYQSRYDSDPLQQSFTAHAYDAAFCTGLAHAWALGSGGGGKLSGASLAVGLGKLYDSAYPNKPHPLEPTEFSPMRKTLLEGKAIDVDGASGPLDFDPATGEAASSVEIWRIDKGPVFASVKWVLVQDVMGTPKVVERPTP